MSVDIELPDPSVVSVIDVDWSDGDVLVLPPPAIVELPIGVGIAGPPGPQGPQGPPGTGGGGGETGPDVITFVQTNPSTLWHIVHGQPTAPSVVVVRDDGVVLSGFGRIDSLNTTDLYFGALTSGTATLNF